MNTQKPTVMPLRPMSRQAIREQLEDDRETLASIILLATQALSRNTRLWSATQPDEAPEFAATSRHQRAA